MAKRKSIVEKGVLAGNYYDKYTTKNPAARFLVRRFLKSLDRLVEKSGASRIHEIGCGEGYLSVRLAAGGREVRGCDFSEKVIEEARKTAKEAGKGIPFKVADIYQLTPENDAEELIVCSEVLEHLDSPERALRILTKLARPYLLLSVPREPLWRMLNAACGRYWSHLGNTPGHIQHWSKNGFIRLLSHHLDIVEVSTPLPWTIVLGRRL